MANFQAPLRIYPYNSWHLQQRGIFNFNTTSSSPTYVHMKTNLYAPSEDSMYMFEAVGYNYGASAPIRCSWGIYTYSGTLYQTGVANIYSGMNADGMYKSSDNYVCIRAYSGGMYYLGFTLNVYACRLDTTHQQVTITAASQNSTSGNYY
jgi:hypothetical protein